MKQPKTQTLSLIAGLIGLGALASARAGDVTYDFTTDPSTIPGIVINGGNDTPWLSTGGNPGGFFALLYSINSTAETVVFPDIDNGRPVNAFTFETDLRIGNAQGNAGRPADGFSISFARASDPVLATLPDTADPSNFAASGQPEDGTGTGLAIGFDTWAGNVLPDDPTGDCECIIVRVDNKTILKNPMATRNGNCDDATSMQTGPYNDAYWTSGLADPHDPQAWAGLCWAHLKVDMNAQGQLTVTWKNKVLLDKFQTTYFPSVGRLVLSGRTGNANENTHFDNIHITTSPVDLTTQPPSVPANLKTNVVGAYRAVLAWDAATAQGGGAVSYDLEENGTVTNTFITTPTIDVRNLKPTTAYTFRVRAADITGNKSDWSSPVKLTTVADIVDTNYAAIKVYGTVDNAISGATVDGLLSDARYPDQPDFIYALNGMIMSFGEPAFGNTFGENYGSRIAGTITPTDTGQYRFFVRSDDASQLYLNTTAAAIPVADGTSQIAEETGCCNAFTEPAAVHTDMPRTSDPINLTAGTAYGVLYVHKEGGGGDWGQVAWRKEGDTTPAGSLKPIGLPFFKSDTNPKVDPVGASVTIATPPQNASVAANTPVSFSVAATGVSPYNAPLVYQWYKDGVAIPGATASNYSIAFPASTDAGKYTIKATVWGASASADATLAVSADTAPPTIASITGSDNFTTATIKFSEPVADPAATTAGSYAFAGGLTVSAVKRLDVQTVQLTTSKQDVGGKYALTITGVKDAAGNTITANTGTLNSFVATTGVRQKYFSAIAANNIASLTNDVRYPNNPTFVSTETQFEYPSFAGPWTAPATGNNEAGSSYGNVIYGWFNPPTTGNYVFFTCSDDPSSLYLSTDDNPANKHLIAAETTWSNPRQWVSSGGASDLPSKRSDQYTATEWPGGATIALTAGKKYYMEDLHSEGGGGDNVEATYIMAGSADPADGAAAIDGKLFTIYVDPSELGGGAGPTLSIAHTATGLSVTFTGTLQSADKVVGPWTDVTGASPQAVTTTGSAKYYRSKQ